MSQEADGSRTPLNQIRDITIDALMEHFANDVMDVDEFERRIDVAHAATTSDELKELLGDLPGGGELPAVVSDGGIGTSPARRPQFTVSSAAERKDSAYVVAIMGGSNRRGRWTPARKNYAVAVMGGTELDFREAVLSPGVTEVHCYTVWGGIEIIVPPGINVESHGLALLGGFEHAGDGGGLVDIGAPTLRITGVALMAGVDISVRLPGETAREARRRRRQERREHRKRLRGG
jgi:hypothetical protein